MARLPDIDEFQRIDERLGLGLLIDGQTARGHAAMCKYIEGALALDELVSEDSSLGQDGGTDRRNLPLPTGDDHPLNAFITRCEIRGGDGPLTGMTVGLKDTISVAGLPLTLGSRLLADCVPKKDATLVKWLLEAGATIVGKLNMEPFSNGAGRVGYPDFGRVRNPHAPDRAAGGSSSGAGAAVAAGQVDVAIGADQGGSLRIPGAWCGVLALKPTHGLIPHTGVVGIEPIHDHVGPLARTTEDLAAVLDCVAGPDGQDPRQLSVQKHDGFVEVLDRGIQGMRVGLLREGFGGGDASDAGFDAALDPEVVQAVEAATETLIGIGARVTQVSIPEHDLAMAASMPLMLEAFPLWFETNFLGPAGAEWWDEAFVTALGQVRTSKAAELPLSIRMFLAAGTYLRAVAGGRYSAKAHRLRRRVAEAYDRAFAEVDVLLMPTVLYAAPLYEEPATEARASELALNVGITPLLVRNTFPFNLTGHPALNVPCGKIGGLPVGMQVVGRRGDEESLLRLAAAFQRSVDWSDLIAVPSGA